jgi:hypothetical protein
MGLLNFLPHSCVNKVKPIVLPKWRRGIRDERKSDLEREQVVVRLFDILDQMEFGDQLEDLDCEMMSLFRFIVGDEFDDGDCEP